MKKFQKVLMVLSVILMITLLSVTAFASSETNEGNIRIEVTTNKDEYKAWGVAEITATITNVSGEDINNVTAQAVFDDLAPAGKRNSQTMKTVDVLKAGESISFTYKATLNAKEHNLNIFEKIFLWFVRLFNGGYTAHSDDINEATISSTEIKFGKYSAENIIEVRYENIKDDNSDEMKTLELNRIMQLNDGNLPEITTDEQYNIPNYIAGKFSEIKISNADDAINALNDIKAIMNFSDVELEFKEDTVNELENIKQYCLQQYYNGIKVYGNILKVNCDLDGNILSLIGSYTPNINIDTNMIISENEAKSIIVSDYSDKEILGSELIIFNLNQENYLVWKIAIGENVQTFNENISVTENILFVSATNGEIIGSSTLTRSETYNGKGTDILGNTRNFVVEKEDDVYYMTDLSKGICLYTYNNTTESPEIVTSNNNTWNNRDSVSLMANLSYVVDYYKKLPTTAFSNNRLSTIVGCVQYGNNINNAFSSTTDNKEITFLRFGDATPRVSALDTVAHEFTHSIISSTCNLDYINQSGAINEAYCDILGNLIENDNNSVWLHGEDHTVGGIRNLTNPNEFQQPDKINGKYMHSYCDRKHDHSKSNCDYGGVHTNSGIINKVAYLIWENGISEKSELAKLFCYSLELMSANATFLDCRNAVVEAARLQGYGQETINIIKHCFYSVGITGNEVPLSGLVVESVGASNEPLADVTVVAQNENFKATSKTDADGKFILNLPLGTYNISLSLKNYTSDVTTITVDENTSNQVPYIFFMQKSSSDEETGTASVHGTVIDKDTRQAIQNMKTMLYSQETQTTLTTYTNEEGVFNFENLPVGEYTVSFEHEEYSTNETATITVTQGVMFVFTEYFEFQKAEARAIIASGNCGEDGDNVTWVLYEDGELVISGSGEMKNYSSASYVPWYSNRSYIKKVTIEDGVTSIADHAFYACESLTSITMPDSVTSIGVYAFDYCTSIASITIPDSVISIDNGVFIHCTSLTSITIPDSVTSIGAYAFEYCTSLVSITIPDSVISIGGFAFNGCSSLTSAIIGDSVTSIGAYAFEYCTSLVSITIPDSVISIDNGVFELCTSLTSAIIGDSVTTIGTSVFSDCESLTSITIPDSVKSIGGYAFEYCTSLVSITIPDSVTSVSNGAFYGCTSLASITIPDSVTSIGGYAFYGCKSLTSITIPNGVTSIGNYAFYGCSSLTSITIPNSVISIGGFAFYDCTSLEIITIPDSVTKINPYVFAGCTSLTDVYYTGTQEEWEAISIDSSNTYLANATIHYNS